MRNPNTNRTISLDDKNLRFIAGIGMLLMPGDPDYTPYPGEQVTPPHKPFHHARKGTSNESNTNITIPHTMSTFKYSVVPKAGGGLTTRTVLGDEFDDATIDAAVATATGLTAAQCGTVFEAYFDQFALQAADTGWSHDFHGRISIRPSSGGKSTTPDGFNNADEINANIALAINPVFRTTWQGTLAIQSQGQVATLTPEVALIINLHDGNENTYTGGEIMQLSGLHLDFDKLDPELGVFYTTDAAPGVRVRIGSYGTIMPAEINAIMPTGVTGPIRIIVVTRISNSVRETLYIHPVG